MSYCLLAISGDCAKGGLSDYSEYIPIKNYFELVKLYLRNQLEINLEHLNQEPGVFSANYLQLLDQHNDLGNALIECKVFSHKWHKRTEWCLMAMDEGKPYWCDIPIKESCNA